jgi:O-antigen/teichoic acid export membrane protein
MKFLVIAYTSFLPVFLSTFAKPIDFAVYSSIEKLVRGLGGLITQSMIAILPMATIKLKENFKVGIRKLKVFISLSFVILIFLIAFIIFISSDILDIYLPDHSQLTKEVFIILLFAIPFIFLSSSVTYGFFIPMNLMSKVNRVLIVLSALSIPLGYLLYYFFGILGFSISIFLVEFSIALLLILIFFGRYNK